MRLSLKRGFGSHELCALAALVVVRRRARTTLRAEQASTSLGIVSSILDLPKVEALGIELRASSGLGAPVSMQTGTFGQEPFRIRHELTLDTESNKRVVEKTLKSFIAHFKWKGVVGVSFTKEVASLLGIHDAEFLDLEKSMGRFLSKCLQVASYSHSAIHTVAAGYNELTWGSSSAKEKWGHKNVLVCTIGKNVGAVLFCDGRRVVNSPLNAVFTSQWTASLPSAEAVTKFTPPEPGCPTFPDWVRALDGHVSKLASGVSTLDKIVLVPVGRTARGGDSLRNALLDPLNMNNLWQLVNSKGAELVVAPPEHEAALVRGIALCSLVELQKEQVLQSLDAILHGSAALHSLSDAQLRSIFDKLDTDCDGVLTLQELNQALTLLGLAKDREALLSELDASKDGLVSFDEFMVWWGKEVTEAQSVVITSADAWQRILFKPKPPPGFGDLVVLEVSFTFCRTCKSFEPKWRKLAQEYPTVRFVQLVGNGTIGAMELCTKELGVKVSPAFFIFRRGGELLAQWTGANVERFVANLTEALEKACREPSPVDP